MMPPKDTDQLTATEKILLDTAARLLEAVKFVGRHSFVHGEQHLYNMKVIDELVSTHMYG
jgi:hypothetical protein